MDLAKLHRNDRSYRYKGQTYRSYSLARAYRENGKNRKEIVVKLGKLSDAEVKKWQQLLKTIKNPDTFLTTLDDIVVTHHYAYLDVACANAIWDFWELDNVFHQNGKLGVATIARILTINRCIEPKTKSQIPKWLSRTTLPWLLDIKLNSINSSRIFRELTHIEYHKEVICKHLFTRLSCCISTAKHHFFYDLSSATLSGSHCPLGKWGHCKEGYHKNKVLALVVNHDGLPFYWDVLEGGTADSKTITWLFERVKKRFQQIEMILVFDRGMVSDDNLSLIENANIKYIYATA